MLSNQKLVKAKDDSLICDSLKKSQEAMRSMAIEGNTLIFRNSAFIASHINDTTGLPIVKQSTVSTDDNNIFVEVTCRYKYTGKVSEPIVLPVFKLHTLKPIIFRNPFSDNSFNDRSITNNTPSSFLEECLKYIMPLNFNTKLENACKIGDIHEKENALYQLYRESDNVEEQVVVLENLINALDEYKKFLTQSNWPYNDSRKQDVSDKIINYINQLPDNYQTISRTAISFYEHIEKVYIQLRGHWVDDAWGQFSNLPSIPPVIHCVCPNIMAMWYQLKAIFLLLNLDSYHLKQWQEFPSDTLIQQSSSNIIYIYSINSVLGCAYKDERNSIIRFNVADGNLLSLHDSIHKYLQQNIPLTSAQNDVIFKALAERHLYRPNNEFGDNAINETMKLLMDAHEALSECEGDTATEFFEKIISPLQMIIGEGVQEKKQTSEAVRKRYAAQEMMQCSQDSQLLEVGHQSETFKSITL